MRTDVESFVTMREAGDDEIGLCSRGIKCRESHVGSEYLHHEGTFPHSGEVITRTFTGIPEHGTCKTVAENAAGRSGFKL